VFFAGVGAGRGWVGWRTYNTAALPRPSLSILIEFSSPGLYGTLDYKGVVSVGQGTGVHRLCRHACASSLARLLTQRLALGFLRSAYMTDKGLRSGDLVVPVSSNPGPFKEA
jgi:hypothetical protein